ncbi:MAG: hypothetical protein R3C16_12300 [Hyphomonadaceae bacterium]
MTPSITMPVQVRDETAVASTVSDLRGGRITLGTYDLASARRIGDATGWQGGRRAIALDVRESAENGTVFNWASRRRKWLR